jgi:hypothetical protein
MHEAAAQAATDATKAFLFHFHFGNSVSRSFPCHLKFLLLWLSLLLLLVSVFASHEAVGSAMRENETSNLKIDAPKKQHRSYNRLQFILRQIQRMNRSLNAVIQFLMRQFGLPWHHQANLMSPFLGVRILKSALRPLFSFKFSG